MKRLLFLSFILFVVFVFSAASFAGSKVLTFQWEMAPEDLPTLQDFRLWSTQSEVNPVWPNDYTMVTTVTYDPDATQPYQSDVTITIPDGQEVDLWFVMEARDVEGVSSGPSIAAIPAGETEPGPVRIDFKPPAIVTNVSGDYNNQTKIITLSWTAPADTDLAQYRVYKASQAGGPYTEVGVASTATYDYTVPSAERGQFVYFVVKAEDTEENLSENSEEVAVKASMGVPFSLTVTVTTN
jgi:hypothetical protein